ncbi:hypothetical protein ACB376_20645 [Klebsiella electrica]
MTLSDGLAPARGLAAGLFGRIVNRRHFELTFRVHGVDRLLQFREGKRSAVPGTSDLGPKIKRLFPLAGTYS